MSKKLSRRDFLKLAGATSAGLALSACGVEPTVFPTATFIPSRATLAPTNTPQPAVLNNAWASDVNTRQVDPRTIFPLVGSVHHINHYALDMTLGTMKLAVLQNQDLTQVSNHDDLRKTIGLQLDSNAVFKEQALAISAKAANLDEFKVEKGFSNLTAIVEGEFVTKAVSNFNGSLRRYTIDREGNIASLEKEEEPPLLPELQVNGPYIERADTRERVILKGFVLVSPLHETNSRGGISLTQTFKYMEDVKLKGGNLVRLHFATPRLNPDTVIALTQKAQELGLYIMFTPTSTKNGVYQNIPLPDQTVEDAIVSLATTLKGYNNVIYDVWSEPMIDYKGGDFQAQKNEGWKTYLKEANQIITRLRNEVGINNMTAVSGMDSGIDFNNGELLGLNGKYKNILFRVNDNPLVWGTHSFAQTDQRYKWKKLLDGNHAVLVGEFLPMSPPEGVDGYTMTTDESVKFINATLTIIDNYGLSYTESAYAPRGWTWNILSGETTLLPDGTSTYAFTLEGQTVHYELTAYPPYQFDK